MNNIPIKNSKKGKKRGFLVCKRLFDIAFSSCFILCFFPLYLLLAIVVKTTSKGPIFYVGKRLGKERKHIKIYKFRSMFVDAEKQLNTLIKTNPKIKKEWEVYQKIRSDPRCTWIGNIMRKASLDELPQFFSVLKGDLSVVGPRPHYISELEKPETSPLKQYASQIFTVKPGITSIWQISGRSSLSYEERVKLDCKYVAKQSLIYDLYLIIRTIPSVFLSNGAC